MRKIFSNLFASTPYIMFCSDYYDYGDDFCINLIIQLAELDTRTFTMRKEDVLLLVDDVDKYKTKVNNLQMKYYPFYDIQKYVHVTSIYDFIDLKSEINEFDRDLNTLDFDLFTEYIKEKNIKYIFTNTTIIAFDNRDGLIAAIRENNSFMLHIDENSLGYKDVENWISTLEYAGYQDKCLLSYLNEENKIVSLVIPEGAFIQL